MKTKHLLLLAVLISFSAFSQKKWTLKECVDYALEHNISIKQNKLNIESQQQEIISSKGNFLPDLSASTSTFLNSGLSPNINGVLSQTNNLSTSFNLGTRGIIFNGFRNLNSYKQAKLGAKSSQLALEVIQDNISLNVVNAYLNILFAKENLAVAAAQYTISKKQILRAKEQYKAGVKPKGDVLNAESTAANDAQKVITLKNTLALALLNLAQLLQIDPTNFDVATLDVEAPSSAVLYDNPSMVYQKALSQRPEIKKANLSIENADLGIAIAKSAFLPTVSYSASIGSSYYHQFNNLLPGRGNDYFFKQVLKDRLKYGGGISINIPIFNRFQTQASVAKATINKENSRLQLENEKLQLQQTIQKAFLDAKAAIKTFEAAKISLLAQKEAFKNAQERFNYGAMTLFDFDQVRSRLVNAEATMIRAKFDYIFKTKVLKFYYGEPLLE